MPPRPPLPQLYSQDENPPAVPPLPREATVIRHTSVRGLKRQSDERKRDREIGQYSNGDSKVQRGWGARGPARSTGTRTHPLFSLSLSPSQGELRPFLSDPELVGAGDGSSHISVVLSGRDGYQTLPSRGAATMDTPPPRPNPFISITVITGIRSDSGNGVFLTVAFPTGGASFSFSLNQSSSISSYVTLRRAASASGVTVRLAPHTPGNARPVYRVRTLTCPSGLCSSHLSSPLPLPPLPPTSGETKERPGASVLRRHGAEAEGEDERRRAAGEDEEAPEGSGPPAQTHPEPRGPPRLPDAARSLFLAPALGRFGISMFLTLSCMTRSVKWGRPSAVVMHAASSPFSI